jgi:hypothetical protein
VLATVEIGTIFLSVANILLLVASGKRLHSGTVNREYRYRTYCYWKGLRHYSNLQRDNPSAILFKYLKVNTNLQEEIKKFLILSEVLLLFNLISSHRL